jgi:hypothetical protein
VASLRQKFTVSWDDGEPVEVTTTVQDLIDAVDSVAALGYVNNRVALETCLIYAGLKRCDHNPPPYREWINLLDNYTEVTEGPATEGPTLPALSSNGQSSSAASPAPTGGPGSTKTRARSKPPKSSLSTPDA